MTTTETLQADIACLNVEIAFARRELAELNAAQVERRRRLKALQEQVEAARGAEAVTA